MSNQSLSGDAILRQVYDPASESLKTSVAANISGAQEVIISAVDDSIKIGDGAGHFAAVNADGSMTTQIVGTVPLSTGASTSALQSTLNTSVASIDTKTPVLGQALSASSVPVVLTAAQIATLTPLSSVSVSNLPASQAVTGTFFQATQPVSASTLPLPTGASTSANQTTGNSSLSSIDGKIPALGQALAAASAPVVLTAAQIATLTPLSSVSVSNLPATQAISAASLPLPAGAGTSALQGTGNTSVASIDTKTPALGQALAAASVPVVLTAGQLTTLTPLSSVSVSNFPASQAVTGTFFQTTQPVSNASLPLPTGASTAANQVTANTSLSSLDTKTPALGQALAAVSVPVVLTAAQIATLTPLSSVSVSNFPSSQAVTGTFFQATQPVSNVSLPLPTGASTSAIQTTGNTSLASIDGKTPALGQALAAASVPVVLTAAQLTTLTPLSSVSVSNFPASQAVTGTFFQATQPVSGAFFQATQPVSAASLPLPTGAATAANQTSVIGTVAAGTAATNSSLTGGVYNTTLPTLTTGQQTATQFDVNGRLLTSASFDAGVKATYSASIAALVPAAAATDIFTITGSATKTVRVTNITIDGIATAAADVQIQIIKRSTANSVGTSTAQTAVPHDANSGAASATVLAYTANPTLGTTIGNIRAVKLTLGTTTTLGQYYEVNFGNRPGQAVVLRGIAQVLAVNFAGATAAGNSLSVSVEWTEE